LSSPRTRSTVTTITSIGLGGCGLRLLLLLSLLPLWIRIVMTITVGIILLIIVIIIRRHGGVLSVLPGFQAVRGERPFFVCRQMKLFVGNKRWLRLSDSFSKTRKNNPTRSSRPKKPDECTVFLRTVSGLRV
jgi:hypothetical protein